MNVSILPVDGQVTESLEVTVIEPFIPFTLSCALLVQLDWPSLKLSGRFVLKLFDRRFAAQLRREHDAGNRTPELENDYRKFIQHNDLQACLASFAKFEADDDWSSKAQTDWDRAQREVYLQYLCRKLYSTETAVYDRLHELQGRDIPRLVARIVLQHSSTCSPVHEYLDCPGILLEYIEGFSLTDLETSAPKVAWQTICDEAIRIINEISNHNIRNEDVKTRSFVIKHDAAMTQFKAVMMDFGTCVLRRPDQDEDDWREWKSLEDEEGAIGLVMERKLQGGFKYTPTLEYQRLMDEFQSEDRVRPYHPATTTTQPDLPLSSE